MVRMGFKPEEISFSWELDMKFGRQVHVERVSIERKDYNHSDLERLKDFFIDYYTGLYGEGSAFVEAGIEIINTIVKATVSTPKPALKKEEMGKEEVPLNALKGKREVFFRKYNKFVMTDIYEYGALRAGNMIKGPAIIEAPTTTVVILPDQEVKVDSYHNLVFEKE
jgi:N-methylhydantoinase A/oxoprolinase/acetone carboxylase beta subunit